MHGVAKKIHGAVASLTKDHVSRAASLVKEGDVYSLALVVSPESYAYAGRSYQVLTGQIYIGDEITWGENKLQAPTTISASGAASVPTWTDLAISRLMGSIFMDFPRRGDPHSGRGRIWRGNDSTNRHARRSAGYLPAQGRERAGQRVRDHARGHRRRLRATRAPRFGLAMSSLPTPGT